MAARRLAAASAEIGVARVACFPASCLSSLLGYDSTQVSTFLHAPSQMWSFGFAAVLTLFDGGRHSAQSFQARAVFGEQVAANYRNRVLTAYQEVEDNLAALRQSQQESVSQAARGPPPARPCSGRLSLQGSSVTYLEVASPKARRCKRGYPLCRSNFGVCMQACPYLRIRQSVVSGDVRSCPQGSKPVRSTERSVLRSSLASASPKRDSNCRCAPCQSG